jgi:hypothetical protein
VRHVDLQMARGSLAGAMLVVADVNLLLLVLAHAQSP